MTTSQILGFTAANIAEVEAATKATRITLRAEDYGSLGIYSLAGSSGIMAAGVTAAAPIWSFRWGSSAAVALIKSVCFTAGNDGTVFTAGRAHICLVKCLSFTGSDSGGTSLLPSGNQNKMRTTGMGTTLLTDCRISSTAALTANASSFQESSPLSSLALGFPATAGSALVPASGSIRGGGCQHERVPMLLDIEPGDYPLVLYQNEGLRIVSGSGGFPALGTWRFGVTIRWHEAASYP